jgi:P2 family phage major capsid protein
MRPQTRARYTQITNQLAELNGVKTVAETFSVDPSLQQKLEEKMQESSNFLTQINIYPVDEMAGELIGLGVGRPVASRTDTSGSGERSPVDPTSMDNRRYMCEQTDFDTAIKYKKLDAWAKFPDFYERFRSVILTRQALDRIMIGFNGKTVATTTNLTTNPNLEDVNKGWLQKQREENASRTMSEVVLASEVVKVGPGAGTDYKNYDALVMDLKEQFIASWHRQRTDLVVLCSTNTLSDKYFPLVNKNQDNSEMLAADVIISQKRMGQLQVVAPPFFPDNVIVVTALENLSIYVQDGARRRLLLDNPRKNQVENFESSNEAYVIEDLTLFAMAENIEYVAA